MKQNSNVCMLRQDSDIYVVITVRETVCISLFFFKCIAIHRFCLMTQVWSKQLAFSCFLLSSFFYSSSSSSSTLLRFVVTQLVYFQDTSYTRISDAVVLHTSMGDIHIQLFAKE